MIIDVPPQHAFTLPDHEEKMVRSFKEIQESFAGCLETHSLLKTNRLNTQSSGSRDCIHTRPFVRKSEEIFPYIPEISDRCCLLVFEQELPGNRCRSERAAYFTARSRYDLLRLIVKWCRDSRIEDVEIRRYICICYTNTHGVRALVDN